ncbi:MAG: hypothetical protein HY812_16765 [Planctomycetes bacterium]|nr:hypothetical protein [Planctomycetota bacterium]
MLALALLALVLSFVAAGGALRATVAILALATAPGAAAILLLERRGQGAAAFSALALALAPFVVGALMTALLFAGLDALWAARVACVLAAGGLIFDLYRARREQAQPAAAEGGALAAGAPAVLAALLLAMVVAVPVARSNRVRASIHGMLHASILYSAVDRGVPPENPFFAGRPLRYYWTHHLAVAASCYLGDVEPTVVFAATTMLALLSFLLLLGLLGRELFRARGAATLAVFLGFLGLNPLGVLFFLKRQPLASLADVAAGADPIGYLKSLVIGQDDRISLTFTKFMNVSSFPASLALLIASFLLLARLARAPCLGTGLLAAAAMAGCIALSPVTGLTAGLALGAAAVVLLAVWKLRRGRVHAGLLQVVAALIGSLVLCAPFVLLGGGGSGGLLAFEPEWGKLHQILWSLGPVLLLGLPAALCAARAEDDGARLLLWSLVILLALAALIGLPVNSEYKMVRMAAPLAGVFAAGSLALLSARIGRAAAAAVAALAVLFFVPTNAVGWNGYLAHSRAAAPFLGEGPSIRVDPAVLPIGAMYDWIRENTPENAVIIDNPYARNAHHFVGPQHGDEVPVLARRPVFTDTMYYMNDYEPDVGTRLRLVEGLFRGIPCSEDGYRMLAELRRPVYLLIRVNDPGATNALAATQLDQRWKRVHKSPNAFLFVLGA